MMRLTRSWANLGRWSSQSTKITDQIADLRGRQTARIRRHDGAPFPAYALQVVLQKRTRISIAVANLNRKVVLVQRDATKRLSALVTATTVKYSGAISASGFTSAR